MKNNKLISLLRTFSGQDLSSFRKYLVSPFFNEQNDLVRLFDILREMDFLKGQTREAEQKLGIWKKLFSANGKSIAQKEYDDVRFRRLFSDLLQLAFNFLAYQQYQQNPATSRVLLLKALTNTTLEKHFAGVVRQTFREQERYKFRDADYHYVSYLLHQRLLEQQEHQAEKSTNIDFLKKVHSDLEQADYHLDCYYLTKKLGNYTDFLSYRDKIDSTAQINMLPNFLDYIETSPYKNELSVKAWHLAVSMLLDQEEESHFFQLKKMLEESGQQFPKKTQKTLFTHLMNYCITTKAHKGRPEYWEVVLSLYKTALAKEILLNKGKLSLNHYKNIIAIALHLKQFSWVEKFIQEHTIFLPLADQENALNYNLAKVYFHQGLFDKVIEQLSVVEYQTIEYAIGSKLLLVQSYYEREEIQALDSLLDSFKVYLRRSKQITKETKQRCFNVLRFTKKLSTLAPYDNSGREKLAKKIEECKNVGIKPWLLEKCNAPKN